MNQITQKKKKYSSFYKTDKSLLISYRKKVNNNTFQKSKLCMKFIIYQSTFSLDALLHAIWHRFDQFQTSFLINCLPQFD